MTGGPPQPRVVEQPGPDTAAAFGSLWTDVTRAGGAVRFRPDTPGTEIRDAAARTLAQVHDGSLDLLVLEQAGALVGTVFVQPGSGTNIAHRAEIVLLMIAPGRQGHGYGTVLLDAAVAHATGRGFEQLLLSARGGTPLPAFYAACGWTEVGMFPDAIRLGPDDLRAEHWFQLRLR